MVMSPRCALPVHFGPHLSHELVHRKPFHPDPLAWIVIAGEQQQQERVEWDDGGTAEWPG